MTKLQERFWNKRTDGMEIDHCDHLHLLFLQAHRNRYSSECQCTPTRILSNANTQHPTLACRGKWGSSSRRLYNVCAALGDRAAVGVKTYLLSSSLPHPSLSPYIICPISSRANTHPSHTQTSRLLSTSLSFHATFRRPT